MIQVVVTRGRGRGKRHERARDCILRPAHREVALIPYALCQHGAMDWKVDENVKERGHRRHDAVQERRRRNVHCEGFYAAKGRRPKCHTRGAQWNGVVKVRCGKDVHCAQGVYHSRSSVQTSKAHFFFFNARFP